VSVLHTISFRVGDLAERLNANLNGVADLPVTGLNTLELAEPGDMTFIGSEKHARLWKTSQASAALVTRGVDVENHDPERRALLYVENADLAMAELLDLFTVSLEKPLPGIHESAIISTSAEIDPTASIGPSVVIGPGTQIGEQTIIEANVVISEGSTIGCDCLIRAGVVIRERCEIGNRVSIHPNAVIGSDGFGYRPDGQGGLVKIPHIGTVIIHDDVEIGANTTIDRGKFGATEIGQHTKIDNLCQIAHNVQIGRGCALSALSGVAGSTIIGDFVQIGGQAGLADHIRVGDHAKIAAHSASARDIPDGEVVAGAPAMNLRDFWRMHATMRKLPSVLRMLQGRERDRDREAPSDS